MEKMKTAETGDKMPEYNITGTQLEANNRKQGYVNRICLSKGRDM